MPDYLSALLREHSHSHALTYAPYGHADHGPMAYLALHALGASAEAVQRFARSYRKKLTPLPAAGAPMTRDDWHLQFGRFDSYPTYLAYFDAEIAARGWSATVGSYLPLLVSADGAFHPLIRLAYGIEFECAPEIAAGLAFMACCGPDPALEQASAQGRSPLAGTAYFKGWQPHRDATFAAGPFPDRCQRVLQTVPLRPPAASAGNGFAELSRACLEIFHATHDFFALHMVTGSAAFRICAPWLGPDADRLLGVTLAAAYLAIGAPDFQPIRSGAATLPLRELESASDEHDIKLAHACREQASAFEDSDYEWVAAQYLVPRLRGAQGPCPARATTPAPGSARDGTEAPRLAAAPRSR
jgi:hypothetical protein